LPYQNSIICRFSRNDPAKYDRDNGNRDNSAHDQTPWASKFFVELTFRFQKLKNLHAVQSNVSFHCESVLRLLDHVGLSLRPGSRDVLGDLRLLQ